MTFTNLPGGTAIFVDANVLVYHFAAHPQYGPASTALFERVEHQEIVGYTCTHVLSEVSHRLMTLEAIKLFGWNQSNIGNRLRTNPAEVSKLNVFRNAIDRILQSKLHLLVVDSPALGAGAALSQQFGLLTNDGLIVAVMHANGLMNLASTDADFDRVPWLVRYPPV